MRGARRHGWQSHASINVADLASAFWICDYTASVRRTADDQIAACMAVCDALEARKFDGDFDKLLQWWQQNRRSEHERLSAKDARRSR
jgi:hypothetical protein